MLIQFLATMRWQDVVDILLNSYILLRLFVLFRGTYVLRVIAGLALLWFLQQVATFLELIVTSWFLQGITAVAAFIMIIVFRNEIRSVLMARNLKNLLWGMPHPISNTPVETLIAGVQELARKRIGALMVLPAREDIRDNIRGAIAWQGQVSMDMLLSVFWPDNPVHDGAAIIDGNRITHVKAILPLTQREDLPPQYGTRHRAAMGLAERTDALILVVSEENGGITVMKGNRRYPANDTDVLTRYLREHTGTEMSTPRKFHPDLLVAATVSLLLISGIWFGYSRGLDAITNVEIPIEYMGRNPNMEIVETSADTASLQLGGSARLIRSLQPDRINVRINLSSAVVGRNTFSITGDNVLLPPGLYLKKVTPSSVEAFMDTPIEKELPIQVDWVGRLTEGLRITQVSVEPSAVRVIGGSQVLENINVLYTKKIQVDPIEESGQIPVQPALQPASLKLAPDARGEIVVRYAVEPRDPMEE